MSRNACFPSSRLFARFTSMALLAGASTAFAANGIKAAYVEDVIPAKTFFGTMTALNSPAVVGPTTAGVYGITSITVTNFDTSAQQVFLFVPTLSGTVCSAAAVNGGTSTNMIVYVQPRETLHLTYPTPFVVNPNGGVACFSGEVTTLLHGGSVQISVNGVIN